MNNNSFQDPSIQVEQELKISQQIRNEKTERLLTPEFLKLLSNLHECLNEERKGILDYRYQINKALQKDFEKVIAEQKPDIGAFEVTQTNDFFQKVKTLIVCPANQTRSLVKLINGSERFQKADAVVVDFSSTLKPVWNNLSDSINNVIEIANESARFSQQTFAEFSLTGTPAPVSQPVIILKPRAVHVEENNISIGAENYPASLFDVALMAYHAFKSFVINGKQLVLAIEFSNQFEAQWWNELVVIIEEHLKLDAGTIKICASLDSVTSVVTAEAIVYELQNRIVALQADFKGKIFNDLKLLQKKSDCIVAERKSLNINETSLKAFSENVIHISRKYGLTSIAGLSINAAGQFVDFKDVSIAKYEEELETYIKLGFNAVTVSHQGYIETLKEKNIEALEISDTSVNEKNLLPAPSLKISMIGLRDNLRTAITFMQAWNQGIASAVFDNRWEDVQTFEIIHAQIYQWIRNSVHLATGERINSRLITTIILEESEKLQNEIRDEFAGNPISEIHTILNTYTQAALEVEQLFLKDELIQHFV
ncbi:MAG: hypothetical protein ABI723_20795 [Bacteroidia bacterium]